MMFHDGETIPGTGLESIPMMAKNQAAFCPCPKNLPETKFFLTLKKKRNGPISLAERIPKHSGYS